jgi:hypothetical protein
MNVLITNLYPVPNYGAASQDLTVNQSVVSFSKFAKGTRYIVLDVQANDIRCTFDGSDPAAGKGHILYAGRSYTWSAGAAEAAKFVSTDSNPAKVFASQFTD